MTDPESRKPQHWWSRLLSRRRADDADSGEDGGRELSIVTLIAALLIGVAFLAAYHFVRPAPPNTLVIATGSVEGAYHLFAQRYRDLIAKEKIKVELRPTTGSVENLKRITDEKSGIDVAMIQGGVTTPGKDYRVMSLAAIYYEPLWIFYRDPGELTLLTQLAGKRIAAGPEGSGTRALVGNVLQASGALRADTPLLPLAGMAAADALIAGQIDAALFVVAPDAPMIQKLLKTPGVRLMSLSQAEALARRFHYLSNITLPRGMIDLAADIPSANVRMVATTAYLVAREDLHPALISVLLQAVTKVHARPGVFRKAGEFPAPREGDFTVSEDAQRFFKSGPPFLQRYMPFWVANLIERLLVLLVPLIVVLIPVMRIMPAFYNWRVKSKVIRWYRELHRVEVEALRNPDTVDTTRLLARLDEIKHGVDATKVPLTYWDYVYTLRGHIDMVRARLAPDKHQAPVKPPPE
jgi:TRAP transporter TAXI family solute receptor